jgi:hypothetical protein
VIDNRELNPSLPAPFSLMRNPTSSRYFATGLDDAATCGFAAAVDCLASGAEEQPVIASKRIAHRKRANPKAFRMNPRLYR